MSPPLRRSAKPCRPTAAATASSSRSCARSRNAPCHGATNTSSVMSLSGYALIAVMQTAELRDLDDLSDARDLARKWTLFVEAQVGPRSVVISEIRSQVCLRCLAFRITKWFRQSLRIEPIRRST
jgi:hypothetical protein